MLPFLNIQDIAGLTGFEFETPCRFYAANAHIETNVSLCRILTRYKVYVDLRDHSITPHLLLDGYWETWMTQFFAKIIKPGNVCIDIGANFGYYAVLMSALSGDTGKVVAVEPNPAVAKLLRSTAGINSPGFHVAELALSDKEGEMLLTIPDELFGSATIIDQKIMHTLPTTAVNVKVNTLDTLMEQMDLARIDVIKMDVEGAEPMIFNGMERVLRNNRKLQIVMEYSPFLYDDPETFTKYLFKYFEIRRIKDGDPGEILRDSSLQGLLSLQDHTDLYLIKKDGLMNKVYHLFK